MNSVEEYGYIGLFLFCLLAATIVPVSSEGAIAGAFLLKMQPLPVLFWASLGNVLGTLINYYLGVWIGRKWIDQNSKAALQRAYKLAREYGWWALALSWLPVIGDPITIVAGVLRWNVGLFVLVVFPLRILRYYLIFLWLV